MYKPLEFFECLSECSQKQKSHIWEPFSYQEWRKKFFHPRSSSGGVLIRPTRTFKSHIQIVTYQITFQNQYFFEKFKKFDFLTEKFFGMSSYTCQKNSSTFLKIFILYYVWSKCIFIDQIFHLMIFPTAAIFQVMSLAEEDPKKGRKIPKGVGRFKKWQEDKKMVGSLFSTFRRMYLLFYQSEKMNNQNQKKSKKKSLFSKKSKMEFRSSGSRFKTI